MNNRHLFAQPDVDGFPGKQAMGPRKEWYFPLETVWDTVGMETKAVKGGTRQ